MITYVNAGGVIAEAEQAIKQGRIAEASAKITSMLEHDALDVRQCATLSRLAWTVNLFGVSVIFIERAVAQQPDSLELLLQQATSCIYGRRYDRAKVVCEQILARFGDHVGAMNMIGLSYSSLGEFDESEQWYRRTLAVDPSYTFAIAGLSKCRRFKDDADDVINLFKRAFVKRMDSIEQARVHYAIAKIYNDVGQYEKAWRHADNANTLIRLQRPFNQRQQFTSHINNIIAAYAKVDWASPRSVSSAEHVLIVGMPRSGTTLMEQILSGHEQYYPGGELPALDYALSYGMVGKNLYSAATFTPEELSSCAGAYVRYFSEFSDISSKRIVNKVPQNYLNIGLFKQMFPRGKVICMRRNEWDVVASIFFEHFSSPTTYTTNVDDIQYVQREANRMMDHWMQVFPDDVISVQYESLVNDFEPELIRICGALGIRREDLSDHTQARNAVETPSVWQVRQGIYQSSIGRWKRYDALKRLAGA